MLIYIIHVPSDHDLWTLPHVDFTFPQEWNPTVLDNGINLELLPPPHSATDQSLLLESTFDEFGVLKECGYVAQHLFGGPNPGMSQMKKTTSLN